MAIGTILGIAQGVSQLNNYLSNRSANKMTDEEIKRLNLLKKSPYIDVNSILSGYDRNIAAQSAKLGGRIDKTLGLDTGQGAGELAARQIGQRGQMIGDLRLQDQVGTANRNAQIDSNISQLKMGKTPNSLGGLALGLGTTALQTYANNKATSEAKQSAVPAISGGVDYNNRTIPRYDQRGMPGNERTILTGGQSAGYGNSVDMNNMFQNAPQQPVQESPKSLDEILIQRVLSGEVNLNDAYNMRKGKYEGKETPNQIQAPNIEAGVSQFGDQFKMDAWGVQVYGDKWNQLPPAHKQAIFRAYGG